MPASAVTTSIAPAPKPTLPEKIRKLVALAQQIQRITTKEERERVGKFHAEISQERRDNEELMESVGKPLYRKYMDARAPFKLAVDTCTLWERHCENAMKAYDREQVRIARERQEEENRKTAAANAKAIEKAEEKGVAPITKAPKIIETDAPKTVVTDDGASSTRRKVKLWRFVGVAQDEDPAKILASDSRLAKLSREFLLPNISRINQAVKMGGNEEQLLAQGIEVYEDFDYTGRGAR